MKSLAEFRAGFNQCAAEVSKNLSASPNSDQLREKLMSHLASSCHGNHSTFAPASFPATPVGTAVWVPYPSPPPSPTSQNVPMYLPGAVAVHRDTVTPISPVSPVQLIHQTNINTMKECTKRTTKPALWRPW